VVSGEHKTISVTNKVFFELVRIKYATGKDNYSEVIEALLDDELPKDNFGFDEVDQLVE